MVFCACAYAQECIVLVLLRGCWCASAAMMCAHMRACMERTGMRKCNDQSGVSYRVCVLGVFAHLHRARSAQNLNTFNENGHKHK